MTSYKVQNLAVYPNWFLSFYTAFNAIKSFSISAFKVFFIIYTIFYFTNGVSARIIMVERSEIINHFAYYIVMKFLGDKSLDICAAGQEANKFPSECNYFREILGDKASKDNIIVDKKIFDFVIKVYLDVQRSVPSHCKSIKDIDDHNKNYCSEYIFNKTTEAIGRWSDGTL